MWTALIFILAISSEEMSGAEDLRFWTAPNQCGARSVYQFQRLMGHTDSLADINRVLPPDGTDASKATMGENHTKLLISIDKLEAEAIEIPVTLIRLNE